MKTEKSFEESLRKLEQVVDQLESGDLSLEKSLDLFEQGVRLSRECQKRLDDAERRVEILLKGSGGTVEASDFDESEE